MITVPARRRWLLGGGLVLVVLMVALVAASQVRSPASVAAGARPPELPPVTATVEKRVLEDAASYAATVGTASTLSVAAPDTVEGRRIVTRVSVAAGDAVAEGDVLLAVAGRPVMVLSGTIPAYRSFSPGARGEDILQLQRALSRLGLGAGSSGVMDERTLKAMARMYSARGYSADGQVVGEVVFVPRLPARVENLAVSVGATAEGEIVTLGYGGTAVLADISDGAAVKVGQTVVIEAGDQRIGGRIASLQVTAVEGAPNRVVAVAVPEKPLPAGTRSALLRVVRASSGSEVLVVPASALVTRDTGPVLRAQRGDKVEEVAVQAGMTAGGYVEVQSADLAAGDLLILGP